MGWQGKGSGNSYNGQSGDAIFVGLLTRKPIAWHVLGKGCSACNGWARSAKGKNGEPCRPHACRKTWGGSSGAMEPVALLKMFKELYTSYQVIVEQIVTDDDSSIKSKLKWSNDDWMTNTNSLEPPYVYAKDGKRSVRPDYSRLPRHMPEPTFVADPNHRKKSWSNALYALEKKKKESSFTMTKMDVVCLGRNMAYMFALLVNIESDAAKLKASLAVVEHHFNNHEHCGDW